MCGLEQRHKIGKAAARRHGVSKHDSDTQGTVLAVLRLLYNGGDGHHGALEAACLCLEPPRFSSSAGQLVELVRHRSRRREENCRRRISATLTSSASAGCFRRFCLLNRLKSCQERCLALAVLLERPTNSSQPS